MSPGSDVEAWMEHLTATFGPAGIVGPRLVPIVKRELAFEAIVNERLRGYRLLTDSFFDFFIETIEIASPRPGVPQTPKNWAYYSVILMRQVTNFKGLRAAENLYQLGYPFDGFSLLRDLKDQALLLAAIMLRKSTVAALNGYKVIPVKNGQPYTRDEYRKVKKAVEREQSRVLKLMLGSESGMDAEDIELIRRWRDFFHMQVHGSRLTFLGHFDSSTRSIHYSLAPLYDESSVALYVNRACEVDWMILRTLPFLQPQPRAFGEKWAGKWQLLDESFRLFEEKLAEKNKPLAKSMIKLIERRFPFTPSFSYFE